MLDDPTVNESRQDRRRRKWSWSVFTVRCVSFSLDFLVHWLVAAVFLFLLVIAVLITYAPQDVHTKVVLGQLDSKVLEISTYKYKAVEVFVKPRSFSNVSFGLVTKQGKQASRTVERGTLAEDLAFSNGDIAGYQVSQPIFIRGSRADGWLNVSVAFNTTAQMTVLAGYHHLTDWIENNEFPGSAPPALYRGTGQNQAASINITETGFYYVVYSAPPTNLGTGAAFVGSSAANYSYTYHRLPANGSVACAVNRTCGLEVSAGRNFLVINSGALPGNMTDLVRVTSVADTSMYLLTIILPFFVLTVLAAIWLYLKNGQVIEPSHMCWHKPDDEYEVLEDEKETESSGLLSKAQGVIKQIS